MAYTYDPSQNIQQGFQQAASGVGNIFTQIIAQQQRDYNLAELGQIYGGSPQTSAVQGFKRFSMGLGQNPTIDFKPTISTRYPNAEGGAKGLSSFLTPTSNAPLSIFPNQPYSSDYSSLLNPVQPR